LLFDADVVPLEPAVFCGDRDDRMAAQCAHCPGLHCRPTTWHKTASFTIDCAEETSVTVTVGIVCSVCVLHAGCGTVHFFHVYIDMYEFTISICYTLQIVLASLYISHIAIWSYVTVCLRKLGMWYYKYYFWLHKFTIDY